MLSKTLPHSEWKYLVPRFPQGDYSFEGLPCPTKKALEVLGEEGITEIDKRFKEMIAWKRTLYGEQSKRLGFDLIQDFINEKGDMINCSGATFVYGENMYAYPERKDKNSENYVIDYTASISNDVNTIIEE